MTESKAKKIEIKDVDGQTLSKLIDYIYTAEVEVTEENVQVREAWERTSWFLCGFGRSLKLPGLQIIFQSTVEYLLSYKAFDDDFLLVLNCII